MPELPEVETTRRGIAPWLQGNRILEVRIRQPRLRWPIPPELPAAAAGRRVRDVARRGKYLLVQLENGTLILHLGMSGSLRFLPTGNPPEDPAPIPAPEKHDHFDLVMENGTLRLRDPRRFGAVLWTEQPPETHPLLRDLGPEPLGPAFDGPHLWQAAQKRRCPVKSLIMDGHVVVGVGNIYANEALFQARIHPHRPSHRIAAARYDALARATREILARAIDQGGTTLRDFQSAEGRPGYFAQALQVYGKTDQPCPACGQPIRCQTIGQRSTFYCPRCQR